ncbi:hypothetical protein BMR07_16740 [Methylococcaceae bacterium CS1]|nr:hypothetical protein BMR07_16740 [Methylococcaceae bacterium CS1]
MLELNQTAPTFALYDAHENLHQLSDYQDHWLVIYFYPKDNTPGCTKEACALRDDSEKFAQLNTKVIGISTDNSKSHLSFSKKQSLAFTLLADPDGKVSATYGALFKLGPVKFCKRHSFIISPDGKIMKIYRSVSPRLHSQELLKDLKDLQTKTSNRRAMLPHNILGLLSPTFIRLRSEWEMPWSPCVRLNYAKKPAPLRLPQMAGRLFGMQFLPPSRATSALRISELPCRLPGTKNHHSA